MTDRRTSHLGDPGEPGATVALGAYVLGGLSEAEARAVGEHVAGCADCRAEVDDLQRVAEALDEVPPEFFLDGPPDESGAELTLQRTLREVRRAGATGGRRRGLPGLAGLAAAAAVVVAVGVAGVVVGRQSAPEGAAPTPSAPASTTVPGTVSAQATDPATGATMAVTLTPAAGWVRLTADVGGIPAGEECQIVVVGRDGGERVAGSWLVSESGAAEGTALDGFALVPPDEVRVVRVETLTGRRYVAVRPT